MSLTPLHTKVLVTLMAVPVGLALLTGCNSHAPGPGSSSGSDTKVSSTLSADDWALAYAKCMRAEGIDFPDPGKGGIQLNTSNADAVKAAATKCEAKLGPRPAAVGGATTEADQMARQLAVAQCFRKNGVDVADPQPGHAMGIPTGVPDKVMQECMAASGAATTAAK